MAPGSFLRRNLGKALVAAGLTTAALAGGFFWLLAPSSPRGAMHEAKVYAADGVIKSFGPDRAYVNIAHEKIEDFMQAMTMSFEVERPEQVAGLEVGDRVHFTFGADHEGRLVVRSLEKKK